MGYLVLITSYFLYGLSDAAGPLAFRLGSDSTTLAVLNCVIPLPFIAGTLLATRQSFRIGLRPLVAASALGVFAGLTALTLNGSYVLIGAGIGTVLHMVHSVVASFGEAALERRPPRIGTLIALALTLAGIGIFSLTGEQTTASALGVALALFSGFTYGAVTLLAGHSAVRKVATFQAQFCSFVAASTTLCAYCLATRGYIVPSLGVKAWSIHTFCAVLTNYAAFALVCYGIRRAGSTIGSIMGALEPVFCALFSVFLLGESFTGANLLGGSLILLGVVVEPLWKAKQDAARSMRS